MDFEYFVAERDRGQIEKLAASFDRNLDARVLERLAKYVELVATWNRRFDLTAARGPSEQVEVLLADALVLADPGLVPRGTRLIDIGSGAGAPALPLLLLREDVTAVLVEPKQKRVAFLHTAIGSLELMNRAQVRRLRLELNKPWVEGQPFDLAISRATFAPDLWLAAGLRIARRTAVFAALAEPPLTPSGASRVQSYDYRLPSNNAPRRITVYIS